MAELILTITQPAHGQALVAPVTLAATAQGDTAGLFFKWFSSLHGGTADHPEINAASHAASALSWAVPALSAFGSHALTLAATDQDGIDLPSINAVTRSVMAGGAPPAAPQPCVVHQLSGGQFRPVPPATATLSKAGARIQVLAPGGWARPGGTPAAPWVANADGQALNGIALALRFEPDGPANEAASATLTFAVDALPALAFDHADDQTWLRLVDGPLPANLLTGAYRLKLTASAAGQAMTISRSATVTA